jgi:hypothetical protein
MWGWNVCLVAKNGHAKGWVCRLVEANIFEFGKGGSVPPKPALLAPPFHWNGGFCL